MPIQTATDFENLLHGSDLVNVGTLSGGRELTGYLSRGAGGGMDITDNRWRFLITREDYENHVVIGDSIVIGRYPGTVLNTYTIREAEPGDRGVRLVLEVP